MSRVTGRLHGLGLTVAIILTLVACQPALDQAEGVVLEVDSPALGRVDGFVLLTPDGERLDFDTTELRFQPEFPAVHLSEHQVLASPIEVTFRLDGERRIVTQLDDA